jgi:hypothetical protein
VVGERVDDEAEDPAVSLRPWGLKATPEITPVLPIAS